MTKQQGLTLIELMVTLLLSSFLLLGILQLFISTNSTDRANASLARLQENGRIALDMLKQDLRRTGYQGCASPTLTSRPNSSRTFPLDAMGEQGTELIEGAATASDSLIMRHARPMMMRATNISNTQVTFVSGNNINFTEGERYEFILTNCEDVAIFTGVASARSDNPDLASSMPNQYTLTSLQGANSGTPPSLYGIPLGEGSQFLQVVENTYAVDCDETNPYAHENSITCPNEDDGTPTLYKNGEPMIANVDNFQVLYGVTSGTQTSWVNGEDLTDAQREDVSRLQISLVISSPDEVSDAANTQSFAIANIGTDTQLDAIADRRLRRVLNTVIDVRNRP
ncbi:PilW family protein [Aquipseudomonas guryensis]|jgi:type IV pilus assembly protein PilW|uniref:PilW family protein n=1 Tax=Aquipseudomonas guryensis TaxID=2759165 RepID=A0A7W4H349_9GAMM|nr:PilW family protein [Pseudomonas guryensis]MBB1517917.1 PilW family protein [Pseudomonas guryensis]